MSPGEEAFHKRLKNWITVRKADEAAVGVMVRTTEWERWCAWKTYFERHDCERELARMWLCESGQSYSVEPGTRVPWMQVPADWPSDFDPSGSYREARYGNDDSPRHVPERAPPQPPPTPEERIRAVERWEREIRPLIAPDHMQPKGTVTDDVVRERARDRLAELEARKDEPIVVGEALRKVIDAGRDPAHVALESLSHTVEVEALPAKGRRA